MITSSKDIDKKLDIKINKFVKVLEKENKVRIIKKGNLTFDSFLENKYLIVMAIRMGITVPIYNLIKEKAPFTLDDWATYLGISSRSINRIKASNGNFKSIQSERILEIAEVVELGYDIFDSKEQFKQWLNTPNFALRKSRPMDLLKDSYGKEMVINELTRIEHGIFA